MFNITRAYNGALLGLHPHQYEPRIRKLQTAFAVQLAKLRRRGDVQDGQVVSAADLHRLKDRGEKQLR